MWEWVVERYMQLEVMRLLQVPLALVADSRAELRLQNPINMDVPRLKQLNQDWLCTMKCNGMRCMWVMARFDGHVYRATLDRRFVATMLSCEPTPDKGCTLLFALDCEYLNDEYVCHDVLVFESVPVLHRDFAKRLTFLYKLRNNATGMPTAKAFYPLPDIRMVPQGEDTDGIIFIHMYSSFEAGASRSILKWKPLEHISVDVLVDADLNMWVQGTARSMVPFTEPTCEFELPLRECVDQIVEMSHAPEGWFPYRVRPDKNMPNSEHVVQQTIMSAKLPVSYEAIVSHCSGLSA